LFSSRRRHTRFSRDWSSDVCSSDLGAYNVSDKSAKHTLSVGTTLGLIYKKLNQQELVWDAQYDDGYFNTDLPSGEFFEKGARLKIGRASCRERGSAVVVAV